MRFYNRNDILYVSINGKRTSTKLKYTKENIKLFQSYVKNDEFLKKFNVITIIPTVLQLCEEVLNEKENILKPTSYLTYYSTYKSSIIPYFDKKINEIEACHIEQWYKTFKSKSGIIIAEAILKNAFEKAILRKYIKYTPFVIRKPKFKSNYEINPFNLEDINIILNFKNDWFTNFLGVAFYSGMRTGEILALKWCDIDFLNYAIDINKTQTNGFLQSPKTKSSLRIIDMLPQVEFYLREQRKITGLGEFVFLAYRNKKIKSSSQLHPYWKNRLKQCNIFYRNIYQTRHSFASNMLSNGEDLNWVSQMLGHKNPSVTQEKYFKYIPKRVKERKSTFLDTLSTKIAQI